MGGCASRPRPSGAQPAERIEMSAAMLEQVHAAQAAAPPSAEPESRLPFIRPSEPANESDRIRLLHALGILDTEREDRFSSITDLMGTVFNVPIAAVSLVDAERQWFKAVEGLGDVCQTGRDVSFCGHTILPPTPQIMVIKDTLQDVRFSGNPLVTGGPGIRFYAGAPLVSSANGYVYGSLCVIDSKPHNDFPPDLYNMLAQFAELTVREIEKDKLGLLQRMVREQRGFSITSSSPPESLRSSGAFRSSAPLSEGNGLAWGLSRAADCFQEGVMLVDAATPLWSLLYTNSTFSTALGVPRDEATSQGFWELFAGQGVGPSDLTQEVSTNQPFSVAVSLQSIYCQTPKPLTIDFRPAATGQLDGGAVGVPADIRVSGEPSSPAAAAAAAAAAPPAVYYFAIIQPERIAAARRASTEWNLLGSSPATAAPAAAAPAAVPAASPAPVPALNKSMPTAFTDVRLGPLIGRGAYGRVYRGSWNGNTVAVKVMETTERVTEGGAAAEKGATGERSAHGGSRGLFEAALSSALSHPNIAHTYQYAVRPAGRAAGMVGANGLQPWVAAGPGGLPAPAPLSSHRQLNEVWVISEFCNRGPLLTAIERGAFLTQPSAQYAQPNLIAVLQTLQEIAAAMHYLHNHDILHGDLTGGNVLLTASDKDSRGFTAKVVDFGLSRVVEGAAGLKTRTMGCAEYMPPELIKEGLLTKAGDAYAFGVIIWELYVGRRAWEGLKASEVLRRVANHEAVQFPPQTPHRLKVLGDRCMDKDPLRRPSFGEVLSEVNAILADTMTILHKFLQASASNPNHSQSTPS